MGGVGGTRGRIHKTSLGVITPRNSCYNVCMYGAGEAMIGKRKADIVDHFISKVRSHPAIKTGPWPKQIDDLEAVLQTLFISDNERAIKNVR
jgi:hypothetical protein